MSGALNALLKANPIKVKVELDNSDIANEIDKIQDSLNSKKMKIDVELNLANLIKNVSGSFHGLTNQMKALENSMVASASNISKSVNKELSQAINSSTSQRITQQLTSIKDSMRKTFGDGLIDTKVFRDADMNIQRVVATITKGTGEIVQQMYQLNQNTQTFELIKQTDVDKIEAHTAKMKSSLMNLKTEVDSLFSELGSNSNAFSQFEKLKNIDIINESDISQLKQLIQAEKELVQQSQLVAQAKRDIASALSNMNGDISPVVNQLKQLDSALDNMDAKGIQNVSKQIKELSSQYKQDEALFEKRKSALREIEQQMHRLTMAQSKMKSSSTNNELASQARAMLELSKNAVTSARNMGQLQQALQKLGSAKDVINQLNKAMDFDKLSASQVKIVGQIEKVMSQLQRLGKWDSSNLVNAFDDIHKALSSTNSMEELNNVLTRYKQQLSEAQAEAKQLADGVELIGKATKDIAQANIKDGIFNAVKDGDLGRLKNYVSELLGAEVATIRFRDGLNQQGQAVTKIDAVMAGHGKTVEKYNLEMTKANSSLEASVNQIGKGVVDNVNKNLGVFENLGVAIKRIPGYIISIQGLQKAIQGMKNITNEIFEVDKAMVEIRRVASEDIHLDTLFDKALVSAKNLGANLHDVLGAIGDFARTFGDFTENQLIKITETATIMSNVSDLNLQQSSESLIGTMNAFNITAEESIRIVDALNEVDNQYAISTAQLATGLSKTGAVAKTFGIEMEEVLGHITAIGSVTMESGDVIGNSLKTIYSRMTTHKEAKSALESVGVAIEEMTERGMESRKVGDIMGDLAGKWHTLSDSQRQNIGVQIAGRNHLTRFLALMNNWGTATQATVSALNSQGSALREQQAYMQSYEAKVNGLKTRFTELSLSIGKSFLSDGITIFLHGLMNLTEGISKFISSLGVLPSLLGIVAAAFTSLIKTKDSFKDVGFLDSFIGAFKKLFTMISTQGTQSMESLSKTMKKFSKTIGEDVKMDGLKNVAQDAQKAGNEIQKAGTQSAVATAKMSSGFATAGIAVKSFVVGLVSIGLQVAAVMAVGWAIGKVIEHLTKAGAKAKELRDAYKQQQEASLEAYNSMGNSFDQFLGRYDQLSAKMKKGTLNTDELEEYKNLQNEIAKVLPTSVAYVDQTGQAHLRSAKAVSEEAEKVRELAKERAKLAQAEFKNKVKEDSVGVRDIYKQYQDAKHITDVGYTDIDNWLTGGTERVYYDPQRKNKAIVEQQEALNILTGKLRENSIAVGDNALAWFRAEGKMQNASSTSQMLIESYAKSNQYTIEDIQKLQEAMKTDDFTKAYIESQNKLESKTRHFGNALLKQYDKFKTLGESSRQEITKTFDTIMSSYDLKEFGGDTTQLESRIGKIGDQLLKVGKNGKVNIDDLKSQLKEAGLSADEAERALYKLAVATGNEALKLAIETGELADYGAELDAVTEKTYSVIDATKTMLGIIDEQANAINSQLEFLTMRRNFDESTWLADDRVEKSLNDLSDMTRLSKSVIIENLEDIEGAFGKASKLSSQELMTLSQDMLANNENWQKMTEGMGDTTKDLFARMIQYTVRGGIDLASSMRLALGQVGTVTEETSAKLDDMFNKVTQNPQNTENIRMWAQTITNGLTEMAGEFTAVTDKAGKMKLAMIDGSQSTYLDTINSQAEKLGMTFKTELKDGELTVQLVGADDVVYDINQISQSMLDNGMAAAMLEHVYRDYQNGIITLGEFIQRSGQIFQTSGEDIEVFNGKLRLAGETGETASLGLAEFNRSIETMGLTIKSIEDVDGNMVITVTDEQGNDIEYVIDKVDGVVKKLEEVDGTTATTKVETDTTQASENLNGITHEHAILDGTTTTSSHEVSTTTNQDSVAQTNEEIKNSLENPEVEASVKANAEALETVKQMIADLITNSTELQNLINTVSGLIDGLMGKNDSLVSMKSTLEEIQLSADSTKAKIDELITALTQNINFGGGFSTQVFDDIIVKIDSVIAKIGELNESMGSIAGPNEGAGEFNVTVPDIDYSGLINAQALAIASMVQAWTQYSSDSKAKFVELSSNLQTEMTTAINNIKSAISTGRPGVISEMNTVKTGLENKLKEVGPQLQTIATRAMGHVASGVRIGGASAVSAMASIAQQMIDSFNSRLNSFSFSGAVSRIRSMMPAGENSESDLHLTPEERELHIGGLYNQVASTLSGFSASSGDSFSGFGGEGASGIAKIATVVENPSFSAMKDDKEVKLEDLYVRKEIDLLINRTESFITKANTVMKDLAKNTLEYRDQLLVVERLNRTLLSQENQKLQQTLDRQRAIERELLLLQDVASHTDEQRKEYNKLQQEFDSNTKEIWKLEESILSLNQAIKNTDKDLYTDWIEQIKGRWEEIIGDIQNDIDKLEHQLAMDELNDDNTIINSMLQQTRIREQSLMLERTYANQVARYQKEYAVIINKYGKDSEQAKKMKDSLIKAEQNHRKEQLNGLKIEKELRDTRESVAKDNVDNLKNYYKTMQNLSKSAIDKEKEALKKLHDEKNKMYDEEKQRINDIYNAKLESLDTTRKEEDYAKKISEYNEKRSKLMKDISLMSRDDSLEGRKKLSELQKELAEVNESLFEEQRNRQDEIYRSELRKQKELEEKQLENKKENEKNSFEQNSKALEDKSKQIENYYSNIIEDEKKWSDAIKAFRGGQDGILDDMMNDMVYEISQLMAGSGSVIMGAENLSPEDLQSILSDELRGISNLWNNIEEEMKDLNDIQKNAYGLMVKEKSGKYAVDPIMKSPPKVIESKMPTTAQKNVTPNPTPPKKENEGIKAMHTVVKGDTLWELAKRYYGDYYKWKKIQLANGNVDPYRLRIGSKLIIPFRDGGYTGDWIGDGGRIAMLHKKELVLTQEQTKHLLDTIKTLEGSKPQTSKIIERFAHSSIGGNINVDELNLTFNEYKGNKLEVENVAKNILDEIKRRR